MLVYLVIGVVVEIAIGIHCLITERKLVGDTYRGAMNTAKDISERYWIAILVAFVVGGKLLDVVLWPLRLVAYCIAIAV